MQTTNLETFEQFLNSYDGLVNKENDIAEIHRSRREVAMTRIEPKVGAKEFVGAEVGVRGVR